MLEMDAVAPPCSTRATSVYLAGGLRARETCSSLSLPQLVASRMVVAPPEPHLQHVLEPWSGSSC